MFFFIKYALGLSLMKMKGRVNIAVYQCGNKNNHIFSDLFFNLKL